jgi:phosphoribosylanthranilate isomerase
VQLDLADLAALSVPDRQRVLPVLRRGTTQRPIPPLPVRRRAQRSGTKADWDAASRLAGTAQVVLAGGLDVTNVADAIAQVRPFGVDVSSGVESSRGVKDPARIREFVAAARAAMTGAPVERSCVRSRKSR